MSTHFDHWDPRQRYLHEPPFATLVDSFIAIVDDGILTPADIRAALRLAVQELAPRRPRRCRLAACPRAALDTSP
jgi:predicted phosphoribosyltransferase